MLRRNLSQYPYGPFAATILILAGATLGCATEQPESTALADSALTTTVLHPVSDIAPADPAVIQARMRSASRMLTPRESGSGASALAASALTSLPASVDLSASIPPPGDQGSTGSCLGWAFGYAPKSYQEVLEVKWSPLSTDHQFSPSWIYNQLLATGKPIGGAQVLDFLVANGADTLAYFPYVDGDTTTLPSVESKARAAHFKAGSWYTLPVTANDYKTAIAAGNIVSIGIQVLPDFDDLNSTSNTVFDDASGASRGAHAIALIGYDDARQAFRLINSWGQDWGQGGYGWMAYSIVNNKAVGSEAGYVLVDAANTPGFPDSTIISAVSSELMYL